MLNRRSVLAAASLAPFAARAQEYPQGVIKFICPFGPGSGADVKCRWYAQKLAAALNRTVVVENRAGAFGNIASEAVAKSKPDGLTLYVAPGSSVLAAAAHIFKKLPFDPINDFEHITTLNTSAFVLTVAGNSPHKSVADLTAHLLAKGDKGTYGSIANSGLVPSELYKAAFGLKTQEIKYRDPGPMLSDLMSGQIDFFHIDVTALPAYIESGKLRALATGSAEKLASMPNIPGAREAGIPNCDIRTWWSAHAPAKTPRAILDRLEAAFNEIAIAPDTVKFLAGTGSDPLPGNSKTLRELLVAETKAWEGYVKLAKIEPQ